MTQLQLHDDLAKVFPVRHVLIRGRQVVKRKRLAGEISSADGTPTLSMIGLTPPSSSADTMALSSSRLATKLPRTYAPDMRIVMARSGVSGFGTLLTFVEDLLRDGAERAHVAWRVSVLVPFSSPDTATSPPCRVLRILRPRVARPATSITKSTPRPPVRRRTSTSQSSMAL